MAVRPILIYGDPKLHDKAQQVKVIDDDVRDLVSDMFETMLDARGIGLAATQLGITKSLIVVNIPDEEDNSILDAFINLKIVETKGLDVFEEGCLSIPGVTAEVERPNEIKVRYHTIEGDEMEMECDGLLARVLQHEYDHLNGVLFVEKLKSVDKKKLAPKLRNIAKGILE